MIITSRIILIKSKDERMSRTILKRVDPTQQLSRQEKHLFRLVCQNMRSVEVKCSIKFY